MTRCGLFIYLYINCKNTQQLTPYSRNYKNLMSILRHAHDWDVNNQIKRTDQTPNPLYISNSLSMHTLANSKDRGKIPHSATFHHVLHCCLRQHELQ